MKKLITILAASALCLGALVAREVTVKGSDTMLNLVQRLSEEFSAANPDVTVSVTGGGSGVGINAIINDEVDLGNASRSITSGELSTARANGVNVIGYVIAIDGVCIITNAANTATQLTVDQLGRIYRGAIKNWNEVGGPNLKISLYGRQPSSGTFVYVRDEAVKGEYSPAMRQMNGNSQIVEGVKADAGGIGYVGVGYAREAGITILTLSNDGTNYYSPLDQKAVDDGKYPLARPLFQYSNGKVKGDARRFVEYELGADGQKVVGEEGFYPVTSGFQGKNAANLN